MISIADCQACADELGLDPKIIQTVARVEGTGDTNQFLYEPHIFSRLTNHIYDAEYPELSYPEWDRSKYPPTKLTRQIQFERVVRLDAMRAYESTSWGIFQIMGFNHKICKYKSALEMAIDLKSGYQPNIVAFGRMIRNMGLIDTLRNHEWAKFARSYNGPGYKLNHYDTKLAAEWDSLNHRVDSNG